jgi:hypothetical protein
MSETDRAALLSALLSSSPADRKDRDVSQLHYGRPLEARIERDALVIRIGVQTLAHAVSYADWANPFDEEADDYIRTFAIVDAREFAKDVIHAMLREREDGSTPLSDFLDRMSLAAVEDGSLGTDDARIKHGETSPLETWATEAPVTERTPSMSEHLMEVGMIEQFCRDLNDAHNEILRLQGVQPEDYSKYDWPEWSAPANSIRWAERVLGKPLSKTSLRSSPLPAEAQEPWQFAREQFIEAARRIEEQCISHSIADMLRDAARHAPSDTKGR